MTETVGGTMELSKENPERPKCSSGSTGIPSKISGKAWGVLQFRKLRAFPFSIFFIVGNEFCERFSYYGMRAVLVLFLLNQLKFSENSSTAIYHAFIVLCYLLPLLGALISDSFLGKYWTILSLSVVYAIGNVVVSVSAIPFLRGINIALAGVGLVVIAVGTGGIKPCVSAFGGDQFLVSQHDMLRRFFSLFYFSINAGSVISTLLTPVLRSYINCFHTCECFTLAFGVPAFLMFVSIIIFMLGTRFYVMVKPRTEASKLYYDVPASITLAIYRRIFTGPIPQRKLLHYACPKYSKNFMNDVRLFLRVVVMLLPLSIFWTLFDQQGSRWTLQAIRMDGKLGKFIIQPDQMQALNPILILALIPFFEAVVYPIFAKCHLLKRPLQRMVVGMLLAGLAFVLAGLVELKIQSVQETLMEGESKLIVFNSLPNPVSYRVMGLDSSFNENGTLDFGQNDLYKEIKNGNYEMLFMYSDLNLTYSVELQEQNITELFVSLDDVNLQIIENSYREFAPDGGHANIQVVNLVRDMDLEEFSIAIEVEGGGSSVSECNSAQFETSNLSFGDVSKLENITVGKYQYIINPLFPDNSSLASTSYKLSFEQEFEGGAMYTIVVNEESENSILGMSSALQAKYKLSLVEVDPPNAVSIFLQVPMYIIITAGEVMFSITGLEFAYSQAPTSMKAMCQAVWLMTVAIGNFMVIIIAESSAFENRAIEFFFFAILIGAVTLLFAVMSFFYKYVDLPSSSGGRSDENERTSLIPDEEKSSDPRQKKETSTDLYATSGNDSESGF